MRLIASFLVAWLTFWAADKWFGINPTWQEVGLFLVIGVVVAFVDGFIAEARK